MLKRVFIKANDLSASLDEANHRKRSDEEEKPADEQRAMTAQANQHDRDSGEQDKHGRAPEPGGMRRQRIEK